MASRGPSLRCPSGRGQSSVSGVEGSLPALIPFGPSRPNPLCLEVARSTVCRLVTLHIILRLSLKHKPQVCCSGMPSESA